MIAPLATCVCLLWQILSLMMMMSTMKIDDDNVEDDGDSFPKTYLSSSDMIKKKGTLDQG